MTYRLVCFDLDGTLIEDGDGAVYWERLSAELEGAEGLRKKRERIAAYKRGEFDYKEWVASDLGNLRDAGGTRDEFVRIAKECSLIEGAWDAVHELKKDGYKLALISHSLNILLDTLFPDHPFDDVHINVVEFDEDGMLVRWEASEYEEKYHALTEICAREGIPLSETVFVGDEWNDNRALEEAGLGIAFCPKGESTRSAADVVIEKKDVREVLPHIRSGRRPRS